MNGNSKREKVQCFIRRMVRESLQEIAFDNPKLFEVLHANADLLQNYISSNVTQQYHLLELSDIMQWKKPKEVK
jgi:hypothetical protein